ncbi:transporter substrate-binding domain-containing protein [Microbacterium sp. 18062]|uniref:transporter substrate-binding domain-containing protein n=1 Tax=Microbacterium sp. 18062 TaxID=2681410 RepID=UPI00135BB994|nr:transporter substrate-binding domain-containing protein [Microbacterium sp. 18062]
MKKVAAIGAASVAAVLALSGCASSAPATEESGAAASSDAPEGLISPSTVTFCIDPEYPPLEYYENGTDGEIIGFDADAARAIAAHWGLEATFEVTTFEGLQPGIQAARCDIIPGGLYMSETRLEVLDGVQYMQTGPALIVSAEDDTDYSEEADLCGLTISAQSGSENATIGEEIAAECGDGTSVDQYPKTADTVVAVVNGAAGALIETDVAAADIVSRSNGALRLVSGFFPPSTQFGMFLAKDSPLTEPLAEALQALYDDGTLAEIAEEYNLDPANLQVG